MVRIGNRYGNYIVESGVPSASGMGSLYRVRHFEKVETFILKMPKGDDGVYSKDVIRRFQREREIHSSLDHSNIVHVVELVDVDGIPGMILDPLSGDDLSDLIERWWRGGEELTMLQVLQVGRGILSALSYLEDKGVVHCDLSPANIRLDHRDRAVIMDFGVALRPAQDDLIRTEDGRLYCKLSYVAPEIVIRGAPEHRSDVYSLGVLLYEMMVGGLPFAEEQGEPLPHRDLNWQPPIASEQNKLIPKSVALVVARMMDPRPELRPSARDLLRRFEDPAFVDDPDRRGLNFARKKEKGKRGGARARKREDTRKRMREGPPGRGRDVSKIIVNSVIAVVGVIVFLFLVHAVYKEIRNPRSGKRPPPPPSTTTSSLREDDCKHLVLALRFQKAESCADTLVATDSQRAAEVYADIARAHLEEHRLDDAARCTQKAAKLSPVLASPLWLDIAYAELRALELRGAAMCALEARSTAPEEASDVLLLIGQLFEADGRFAEALYCYELVLELSTSPPKRREAQVAIDRVQASGRR